MGMQVKFKETKAPMRRGVGALECFSCRWCVAGGGSAVARYAGTARKNYLRFVV